MSVRVGKVLLSVFAAATLAGCTASGHAVTAPTTAPLPSPTSTAAALVPFTPGYGQSAIDVAHELGTCRGVRVYRRDTVRCVTGFGKHTAIATTPNALQQELLVALNKDHNKGSCMVVVKGVIIGAPTEAAVTQVIGIPEQFAADHGGYALCPIR